MSVAWDISSPDGAQSIEHIYGITQKPFDSNKSRLCILLQNTLVDPLHFLLLQNEVKHFLKFFDGAVGESGEDFCHSFI